jgi:hypothetical protein
MNNLKNFTRSGNPEAESIISNMLSDITKKVLKHVSENHIRSLILLGGYGKGEGGVMVTANTLKPHNNFDLMLITKHLGLNERTLLQKKLDLILNKFGSEQSIGIDISVMSEDKIKVMPTRVLWYDMKEGHRTLYGDDKFISSIPHLKENIPDWDVRNLMVNRGSLLLINHLCLMNGHTSDEVQRLIIKHTMKAVIGYGDALLHFKGLYHWSYAEKQQRILKCSDISVKFQRIYNDAINFRFSPKYEFFQQKNLKTWHYDIAKQLEEVHLQCEAIRLNQSELNWDNYLQKSLGKSFLEKGLSPRELIKSIISLGKPKLGKVPSHLSLKDKLAYRLGAEDSILPLLFPFLAFNPTLHTDKQEQLVFLTSHFQKESTESLPNMIRAYLRIWGLQFDLNLQSVLNKNQISI